MSKPQPVDTLYRDYLVVASIRQINNGLLDLSNLDPGGFPQEVIEEFGDDPQMELMRLRWRFERVTEAVWRRIDPSHFEGVDHG